VTPPSPVSSWTWLWRYVVAALVLAALGWRYFALDQPLPVIDVIFLAFHESSHWASIWMPRTLYVLAGSVGQVAIPLAIGVYLHVRGERLGIAVGLGWAGLSCAGVARYIADAPTEDLPLVGGTVHDWAYLLGPEGFGGMDHAARIASAVDAAGAWCVVAAVAWCIAMPVWAFARDRAAISAGPAATASATHGRAAAASILSRPLPRRAGTPAAAGVDAPERPVTAEG